VLDTTGYFPAGATFAGFSAPKRLLDTRPGLLGIIEQPGGSFGADIATGLVGGSPKRFVIGGQGGIPVAAAAVALNIVAVGPLGPGYVSVYPCTSPNDPQPATSTINYTTGNVANSGLVTMRNGGVCVVSSQPVNIVVDATGYID